MDTRKNLGRALALRSHELSLEWHRQIERSTEHPTKPIFPPDSASGDIPGVIAWIADRLHDTPSTDDLVARLRPLVRLRREQDRSPDELLREFRLLGQILGDALVAEIDESHATLPPGRAARLGSELAEGVLAAVAVMARLYREEELATERAVSRRLDEYSRILTHELIDPLSSADLASQALTTLDLSDDDDFRDMAERVQRAVRGAARVVEGVRALTLAHDQEPRRRRAEPLSAVVKRVVDQSRDQAEEASVRIEVAEEIPEVVVDGARIELVLRNLLLNALKYSEPTRPECWVRVRAALEGTELAIEVEDNGIGIAREQQDQIFDRFYRAGHEGEEGHGLGLAIAREAVQQVGGEIRCDSEPGEGSTFYVRVPVRHLEGVPAG